MQFQQPKFGFVERDTLKSEIIAESSLKSKQKSSSL